ncbi:response regulator, partial [Neisseria gonorrhoeae]
MEVQLPKIKTVRVMLAGMTAQQESVFKMAFKM